MNPEVRFRLTFRVNVSSVHIPLVSRARVSPTESVTHQDSINLYKTAKFN